MKTLEDLLREGCPGELLERGVPLGRKTTLRIGGPARLCITARRREHLCAAIAVCRKEGIPWFLLGGGSNLLFSDKGFEGLAVVCQTEGIQPCGPHALRVEAGETLMSAVEYAVKLGWSGLEQLAGIPGSLGGAVVGNAGAYGRNIGELVESLEVLNSDGECAVLKADEMEFSYRESRLKHSGEVLLSATLRLAPGDTNRLSSVMDEILATRASKHPPYDMATAGSFFKNLPPSRPGGRRIAAGLVLDQAGARGLSAGDACVFEKHANIVVNRGHASARDILELTGRMKQLAYHHAGVLLEEEVRRIGFSSDELEAFNPKAPANIYNHGMNH